MSETTSKDNPFAFRADAETADLSREHGYAVNKKEHICRTDPSGSPFELVLHNPDGFVPLWAKGVELKWRFQEASLLGFQNKQAVKSQVTMLLNSALELWGPAVPVKITQSDNEWDFEIVVRDSNDCTPQGCTLAQAFFPDSGRHKLLLFPRLFQESIEEQIETLAHELGHVFGLRHFFAAEQEKAWPSLIFGTHNHFTIMNYGDDSQLTDFDKQDLRALYESVWNGTLTQINGVPIHLFQPYHLAGTPVV